MALTRHFKEETRGLDRRLKSCKDLEEFLRLTGYTFPGLALPEDVEAAERSIWRQTNNSGNHLDYVEYRIVRKDGAVRWIEDYGHFARTERYGDLFYVFVEDATEKRLKAIDDARTARLAQERLETPEYETTALKLVHEILHSGVWTMEFDRQGKMAGVFWIQDFRTMIGYHDEEDFPNVLSSWSDLLHPEDHNRVLKQYYAVIDDYTGRSLLRRGVPTADEGPGLPLVPGHREALPAGGRRAHHLCGHVCGHHGAEGDRRKAPGAAQAPG